MHLIVIGKIRINISHKVIVLDTTIMLTLTIFAAIVQL